MRKRSVEVLDDADAYLRKASWIAFQEEISFVWDTRGLRKGDWRPGDPLFLRPRIALLGMLMGEQHVRYMIDEILDDEEFTDDFEWYFDRCVECAVFWVGDEPCFICGQVVQSSVELLPTLNGVPWAGLSTVTGSPPYQHARSSHDGNIIAFDVEMYSEAFQRFANVSGVVAREAGAALRAMGAAFSEVSVTFESTNHMHMMTTRRAGRTTTMRGLTANRVIMDAWEWGDQEPTTITVEVEEGFVLDRVELPFDWERRMGNTNPSLVPEGPFCPELDLSDLGGRMDDNLETPISRMRRNRGGRR